MVINNHLDSERRLRQNDDNNKKKGEKSKGKGRIKDERSTDKVQYKKKEITTFRINH